MNERCRVLYHISLQIASPNFNFILVAICYDNGPPQKTKFSSANRPNLPRPDQTKLPPLEKNCRATGKNFSHHWKKLLAPLEKISRATGKICRATASKLPRPTSRSARFGWEPKSANPRNQSALASMPKLCWTKIYRGFPSCLMPKMLTFAALPQPGRPFSPQHQPKGITFFEKGYTFLPKRLYLLSEKVIPLT